MVKKIPNSGSISTSSPSVKINIFFLSFLHVSTTWICWAATDSTGSSMRLNSSKQPQLPDCAKPDRMKKNISYLTQITSTCALNGPKPAWSWTRPVSINNADYINNKLENLAYIFRGAWNVTVRINKKKNGSISVSRQLPTYLSPNSTLTLTCYQLTLVELGEG